MIDANILVSLLVARNERLRRHFFMEAPRYFYSPKFIAVELFKHKERIAAASALEEEPLLELLYGILSRLRLYDEALIELGNWVEADPVSIPIHMSAASGNSDDKTGFRALVNTHSDA